MNTKQITTVGAEAAAMRHDAMVAAYDAQQARLVPNEGDAWAGLAQFFQLDPRRDLDPLLEKVASYLVPDDTLLDVGGGAGRMSLPLSFHCREVIVVDPSAGMAKAFGSALEGSGIVNARFVHSDWLDADGIEGDVSLVGHVTYFVPRIVPFVEKLNDATRRRVIVSARSVPPPNQFAPIFRLLHDEEMALVPGPGELRSVLDGMGIVAETIDLGPAAVPATVKIGQTREETIQFEVANAGRGGGLKSGNELRLERLLAAHFDELFAWTERGFSRRSSLETRDLLITWETS